MLGEIDLHRVTQHRMTATASWTSSRIVSANEQWHRDNRLLPIIVLDDDIWRYDWGGFHIIRWRSIKSANECIIFPFWWLVIPMTLLSAYLLLSKPCQRPNPPVPHA